MKTSDQHETEPLLLAVGPDEASQITGVSRTRIFQEIRDGALTAHKAGKSTIIEIDELRRWVRSLPTRGRKPSTSDITEAQDNEAKPLCVTEAQQGAVMSEVRRLPLAIKLASKEHLETSSGNPRHLRPQHGDQPPNHENLKRNRPPR